MSKAKSKAVAEETPAPAPEPKPEIIKRECKYTFTREEVESINKELLSQLEQHEELVGRKKRVTAELGTRVKTAETEISDTRTKLKDGFEFRQKVDSAGIVMNQKCKTCGRMVDNYRLSYAGECHDCKRRRDDDRDESQRQARQASDDTMRIINGGPGDCLNTGIPGGLDMDITTPL